MMGILKGKVALVTGSGQGIGRATAQLLAEHGARVVICDIDAEAAKSTAAGLGVEATVFVGDLTEAGAPDRLVQSAIDTWGAIDIIVNNAGYPLDGPIHKMSDETWSRMLEIHATVPFQVIRAAAPHLRDVAKAERARGEEVFRKIVNVSSTAGTTGNAGQAAYAAGKAAVVGLTKTLAKEWAPFKINCNAVAFGYIDTRLTGIRDDTNVAEIAGQRIQLGMPDEVRERAVARLPFGRPGTAREAAGGIFLLCTPWSDWISGQVLTISGGQTLGMS